jgi:hypothetical protein
MLMQGDVFGSYNDGPSAGADVVGGLYVSATHPMLTVGLSEETTYDTFQSGAFHTKVGNTIKVEGRLWVRMNADANGSVPAGKVVTRTFNYDTRLLLESTLHLARTWYLTVAPTTLQPFPKPIPTP